MVIISQFVVHELRLTFGELHYKLWLGPLGPDKVASLFIF
jgi:hypothetical protein